jgi:hypothetical protein
MRLQIMLTSFCYDIIQLLLLVVIAIVVGAYSAQLDIAHPIPTDYFAASYEEEVHN